VALGALQRGYGRLADAAATLDTAISVAQEIGERELLVRGLTQRAEVAVIQAELGHARDLLARAHAEAQRLESRVERAIVARALGRLLLAEAAGHATVDAFEEALREGAEAWGPDERLVALYWLGTAQLDVGQVHLAKAALRQALQLAEDVAGRPVLAGPAAEDARLLQYGRHIGLDPPALGEIDRLAARRRAWSDAATVAEIANFRQHSLRLEVHLFGSLVVYLHGTVIDAVGKRDRARELLALLALHPEGLPAGEMADLLYPDMEPDRALANLRMTVYLLRRFLGGKAAIRHATLSYRLAPQLDLWVDARAFDSAIKRSRGAVGSSALQGLDEAVKLYQGPLLADAGWGWLEPFRRSYAARAAEAALRLSELLASTDPGRSDALAEQVLALEPDNEAAFERLVRNAEARHDTGAREAALRRYPGLASRLGVRARSGLLRAI
jgi:DNA-binding SARP family transcriptional activator